MNNYKSQGQTFEEALVNLSEDGIFVEDPFFKQHMENIRKQRELGLGFDMEKAKKVVEDAVSGIDYSDLPEAIRNRTLLLDIDQLRAVHGAKTEVQADQLMDMITMLPPHTVADGEFVSFEVLKGRSPTGRFDYPFLPDMHHIPRLNKTYMPPKDGDAFPCMESEVDWSRLEELCKADLPRPDLHISGDDPALKIRKHPMIFKVTDLAEDKEEFPRLKKTLERNQQVEDMLGWPAPPMFIEAIPDVNVEVRAMDEVMKELTALARQYKVEIYFGTKPALKTVLYSLMYGAKKKDLDMSQIEEISVEKAAEMLDRQRRKIATVGKSRGLFQLIGFETFAGISRSLDNFELFTAQDLKVPRQPRDWEHTKLRRGKGHNKFKRKGKK